jgi:hypothetical protein
MERFRNIDFVYALAVRALLALLLMPIRGATYGIDSDTQSILFLVSGHLAKSRINPMQLPRILALEGVDAGVRGLVRIDLEATRKLVGDRAKPLLQPFQAPLFQSCRSTAWISGRTTRSPSGLQMIGKMTLPRARACVSSAKHHFEATQFGVSTRMRPAIALMNSRRLTDPLRASGPPQIWLSTQVIRTENGER